MRKIVLGALLLLSVVSFAATPPAITKLIKKTIVSIKLDTAFSYDTFFVTTTFKDTALVSKIDTTKAPATVKAIKAVKTAVKK
jgi:hypothetical protein